MRTRVHPVGRFLAAILLLGCAAAGWSAPQLSIAPQAYEIVRFEPVRGNPNAVDVRSRAGVSNSGDRARGVAAHLVSTSSTYRVLDGNLHFGNVRPTGSHHVVFSRDTFKLRIFLPPGHTIHNLLETIRAVDRSLQWQIDCRNCSQNQAPVANAGPDQTVFASQLVTLDGGRSTDPKGHALTYKWSFVTVPAGSAAHLNNATSVNPTFTPDRKGDYLVQLIVNDGTLDSAADSVQISTVNSPPVANAGADQTGFVGQLVQLDGSGSTDMDGDSLTYAWTIASAPDGSTAAIQNPDAVKPTFRPDVRGEYLIQLEVDDGTATSAADTMMLSTLNSQPVANAGPDQTVHIGDNAVLDGSGSSDADHDPLTFQWALTTRPVGSVATLKGPTTENPSFAVDKPGTYVAQLVVNDGTNDSEADTVSLSTINSRPVAIAGPNQSVHFGATVQLNGSGSSDPDGDPLGFTWAILSQPDAANTVLSDAHALAPSFTATHPGLYVVQLVVDDGKLLSDPSTLTVTAEDVSPIAHDDTASTASGMPVTINVLANDSDPDADVLRVQSVTQPSQGSVSNLGTSIQYTPPAGFSGQVSFTYVVTDGIDTATATVTVTVSGAVNQAPVAKAGADQHGYVSDALQLSGSASFDPDGSPISYAWVIISGPAGGATLDAKTVVSPRLTATVAGTYVVQLIVSDGVLASAPATVRVIVDPLPALTITDAQITEGNTGTSVMNFAVTLSAAISRTVTVSYSSSDGTATAPSDYISANGTLSLPPNTTSGTVAVQVVGDTTPEANETLNVTLTNPSNATIGKGSAIGTIIDDDTATAPGPDFVLPQTVIQGFDGVVIDTYTLVASTRVSDMVSEYTYSAQIHNWSTADLTMTAVLGTTDTNITVAQSTLDFGTVPQNATRQSTGNFTIRVDQSRPAGTNPLVWTVQAMPLPQTSYELIDAAVTAGTIGSETALLYKVYLEFHDARLPAQFRGRNDFFESTAVNDAIDNFTTLSAPTQALLRPFLLPPDDPASWYQALLTAPPPSPAARAAKVQSAVARGQAASAINAADAGTGTGCDPLVDPTTHQLVEGTVLTANQKVCITYFAVFPGDQATATALAQEFDTRIWPTLTGLLGEPPLDAHGHLQVHLVDAQNMTLFYQGSGTALGVATLCSGGLPHIYLSHGDSRINQTAAHELLHAITANYARVKACHEAFWLGEASATWAEQYVYPCVQSEHPEAPHLLGVPSQSLETTGDYHEYGAYLWMYYATQPAKGSCDAGSGVGDPQYVKRAWQALSGLDSLHAIAVAFTGTDSLAQQWHDFALNNWNRDQAAAKPYVLYRQADSLLDGTKETPDGKPIVVNLGGAVAKSYGMSHSVAHLGAVYYHFDLSRDPSIRRVRLVQPYSANAGVNTKVQVILRTDQGWQKAVDWTAFKQKTLCRDKSDEHFQEMVVVISNSEFNDLSFVLRDNDGSKTKLMVSALGCTNWRGSANSNYSGTREQGRDVITATTNSTDVTFVRTANSESWENTTDTLMFSVTGGTVNWTLSEDTNFDPTHCSGSFSDTYSPSDLPQTSFMKLGDESGAKTYFIQGVTPFIDESKYQLTCSNGIPGGSSAGDIITAWLVMGQPGGIDDTAGGVFAGELQGSSVIHDSGTGGWTYMWTFVKDGTFDSDQD